MGSRFSTRMLLAGALLAAGIAAADAKTFRVNVVADPQSLDPIAHSELVAGRMLDSMYEGFTAKTASGQNEPSLATSWEPIEGGLGWRFHLRPGVKFHSGRPFTAKDVKYTFEQILTPGMKGGLAMGYLARIVGADDVKSGKAKELAGVKVVDDLTLEVRFTKPDVLFPIYPFLFVDSGIVADQGADWMNKVSAGTGPFKFKEWRRGSEVAVAAHADYWGGAPKIEGVRYLIVPSGDTAISQYDAGELDMVDVPEASFRRVLRDERYKDQLSKVSRAQSRYLGMNATQYEPFKDKRVREAISLSIDRDAMIKGLYGGAGFPLNGVVTPGVAGYNPDLAPLKYDPERAKQLLAEAGYPDGKGMPEIDINCTPQFKDEITYYANQLGKVLGMKVNPVVMERATFIKAMNAGEVAFFPWGWTADYPDAMYYLSQMWYSTSPYNRPRWKSPEYDKIIDEAQTTAGANARYALYHKAEKVLMDDWGTAPLPMTAVIGLVKPNVKNAGMTPFGFSSFKNTTID